MSAGVTRSRILVGVDGSSASDAAVRWAAREAAIRRQPITLIHALAPSPIDSTMAPNGTIPQLRLDQARQILDQARQIIDQSQRIAAERTDRRLPPVHTELAYASVVSTLIEASKDAQMIVTGSRDRAGLRGGLPPGGPAGGTARVERRWGLPGPGYGLARLP